MRCTKCVLPEQTPNIVFDNDGVCNYCRSYRAFEYRGESELLRTLDGFRTPNREYDCVLGLSGGRDSSYALLKLVKDYDIKVLAVNYENPFTVPQAKANIENAISTLNVSIVRFPDTRGTHKRLFRDTFEAWLRKPSPALIPIVCIGCKPAWLGIYRAARQHGIHCLVTGGNPLEVMSFKREMVGISRDENPRSAFHKYAYSLREILRNGAYLTPTVIQGLLRAYLLGNPHSSGVRLLWPDITWVELFGYTRWDEQEAVSRIETELGWRSPPESKSTWRFDCSVKHLLDLMYMTTLNMTDKDDFYAKMVRESLITREAALQRLQVENRLYYDVIRHLLDQAGVRNASSWIEWCRATVA